MRKDNVELICDVAELSGLFEQGHSLDDFLQAVTSTVAHHMRAAVCSVYLYDEERGELVLRANQGLAPEAVGRLRMKLGEGISGLALKELRPIREARGSRHPGFKFIPGIEEDRYEAFLAVPIVRGLSRIGVLVVQDTQPDYFDEKDTRALQAIAAQLAATMENVQLLIDLHQLAPAEERPSSPPGENLLVRGVPVCEGLARGRATIIADQSEYFSTASLPEVQGRSLEDFHRALAEADRQIRRLQQRLETGLGDIPSLIFSAHLLMLRDKGFSGKMEELIRAGSAPAAAIAAVVNDFIRLFSRSQNSKLREKVYDVKDLGHRLLHNLNPRPADEAEYQGEIVIAAELLPSDILKLSAQGAEGLVLVGGSTTSHVSILARSLNLPALVAEDRALLAVPEGTPIQMDARQGTLYLNPGPEVLENYERLQLDHERAAAEEKNVEPRTHTADGERVVLMANVNLLSDLDIARRLKAEGVGLYRSEFPFIVRNDFPSQEEQYRIYRALVERMSGMPVMLRTLDVGGDKMLSYFPNVNEANPFLGLRALRFSLRNKHIFAQQLQAMLRAGAHEDMTILFPLVASVDDFVHAREVVRECLDTLADEGLPHHPNPALGAMVEIPSAVEVADELAQEADRLCIGTNDLVQYTLGVDRTNEEVSDLYFFHHPAVLRSLKKVVDAAHRHGKPVSVCGDVVGDEKMLPFLLGIGVRMLSMNARRIPAVQAAVARIHLDQAREQAHTMLGMGRVSEVNEFLDALPPPGS